MEEHHGVGREAVGPGTSAAGGTASGGGRGRAAAGVAGGLAALAYGWWVVSLPPFSASATAAVVLSGIVAGMLGRLAGRQTGPAGVPRHPREAGAWAALAVVAAAWELAAYLQHPRADHPTLSSLGNAALDSHPARTAAFVLWLLGAAMLGRR